MIERGAKKMSTFFLQADKGKFPQTKQDEDPDLFYEVFKYIEKNPISKFDKYPLKQEQKIQQTKIQATKVAQKK